MNTRHREASIPQDTRLQAVWPSFQSGPPWFDSLSTPVNLITPVDEGAFSTLFERVSEDPVRKGRKGHVGFNLPKVRLRGRKVVKERRPGNLPVFVNWNSFQHYKIECFEDPTPERFACDLVATYFPLSGPVQWGKQYSLLESNLLDRFGEPGRPIKDLPEYDISDAGFEYFIEPPSDLDELISYSLKSMLPFIKHKVSLINSIIELKDFVTLKDTHKRILRSFSLLKQYSGIVAAMAKTAQKRFRNSTLRELLQAGANVYLQKEFNFAPLLSDIAGVSLALKEFETSARTYSNNEGRPTVAHFNATLLEEDGDYHESHHQDLSASTEQRWQARGLTVTRDVLTLPTEFKAQVQYNANYSAYQLEHARALALLDRVGVNLNPQVIWNAIPWSFVVDWVADVGNFLARFRKGNLDPQLNILQFSWSVKRQRDIICSVEQNSSYRLSDVAWIPRLQKYYFPVVRETAYRRQVGLPGESSFTTSGLNSHEFTLAAALAITHKRGKTKRIGFGTRRLAAYRRALATNSRLRVQ